MFLYVYYFLALIIYILAIPYLFFKSFTPKYAKSIPAKFFLKNNSKFTKRAIWFHSCSMGETSALKNIFDKLSKNEINLSVITNTGYSQGLKMGVETRYLPYEIFLPFWIKKQKLLLVMEAELWYMLFLVASKKGATTILINARISDKSYKKYKKYKFFYRHLFKYIDKIFAQSQIDKERLIELGACNIEVIGNIKLSSLPKVTKVLNKPKNILITAGSTHEGEEELILNAWEKSQGKLVIVPRHPERFNKVYNIIEKMFKNSDITFHRYSKKNDFDSDIILIDKMGILNNIYAISDVVILGGAFCEDAGGHNPVEPAFFNCKLISGRNIFNQKALFESIENVNFVENSNLGIILKKINYLKKATLKHIGDITPILHEIDKKR
jgi:3-deoxy-D-manno-octulosonic-acid transferase